MRNSVIIFAVFLLAAIGLSFGPGSGEFYASAHTDQAGPYRVGERLTYNISFDRFPNVAYAETNVISRGRINGKDAFEVQSKLRTLNFVTVGFMLVDTSRTTFVSPVDGTTLFVKNVDLSAGAPVETVTNYAEKAPGGFDLTSILFKIRASGGAGSFTLYENEKSYPVVFQTIGSETVKSDAGEFPANIVDVKSEYLTENGFSGLKISITSEGSSIPIQFRLKTGKSEMRALIASIQVAEPEPTPTPTSVPVQTPRPTPRPSPTATPYLNNQPLTGMPFALGETLEYRVRSGARTVGTLTLNAKERKLVGDVDSLVLSATVTNAAGPELFRIGNIIRSNVDPDTLAPLDLEVKFDGPLLGFNQSVRFDQAASTAIVNGGSPVDLPVGTHNILSFIYAIRMFNLTLSKSSTNPVNDTRVAVFWHGKANVFTLRPAAPQQITLGEQRVSAQQISISTGNPQLDALSLKVWLSTDERRTPLRFSIGAYQLDLVIKNESPTL